MSVAARLEMKTVQLITGLYQTCTRTHIFVLVVIVVIAALPVLPSRPGCCPDNAEITPPDVLTICFSFCPSFLRRVQLTSNRHRFIHVARPLSLADLPYPPLHATEIFRALRRSQEANAELQTPSAEARKASSEGSHLLHLGRGTGKMSNYHDVAHDARPSGLNDPSGCWCRARDLTAYDRANQQSAS